MTFDPTLPNKVVDGAFVNLTADEIAQQQANDTAYAAQQVAAATAAFVASAQAALTKSDITVTRCVAAQPPVAVPAALTTYRALLRAIVKGEDTTSTVLPTAPPMPAGI